MVRSQGPQNQEDEWKFRGMKIADCWLHLYEFCRESEPARMGFVFSVCGPSVCVCVCVRVGVMVWSVE